VGLNPPLHTQHNEGVDGCNEDNQRPQLVGYGQIAMKVEFPTQTNKMKHTIVSLSL